MEKLRHPPFSIKYILQVIGVAIVYYTVARLGLLLAFQNTNASPVWPPSGFAFAAIFPLGKRMWPGIFIGDLCVNLITFSVSKPVDSLTILMVSSLIAIGNTLEALTGFFLYRRFIGERNSLDHVADIFQFVFIVFFMCLVSALIGPTSSCVLGITPWSLYKIVWFTWWLGDATGTLILTPVFLAWAQETRETWSLERMAKVILLFLGLYLITQFIFGQWFEASVFNGQSYLLIPFLLVAIFLFGPTEVTMACATMAGLAVWHTIHGFGPFVAAERNTSLLTLQAFISVVQVTMLLLVAALTERQLAENLLLEKTKELERSNKELEQFAHIASHDLQEPIRSIVGFSQLLSKKFEGKLDVQSKKYLDFIVGGARRLQMLIEGLLQFSRFGKDEIKLEPVNFNQVVKEAMNNLDGLIQERQAVVHYKNLPILRAHYAFMLQLFQNLISNSIKYCDRESPHIEIWADEKNKTWEFSVQDNGIGIDPQYQELIFIIFQRLHGKEKYPGTGIGLTICKKIVERHGGKIWVESMMNQGATFKFTLPST